MMRMAGLGRRVLGLATSRGCLRVRHIAEEQQPITVAVDRSGLCQPKEHEYKEPLQETNMSKHIQSVIQFRGGPISVAAYMEEVLTNPVAGYYMHRDVFGSAGSFVTSPDISQMFGELIGVWTMCVWEQMGKPSKIQLVELGPGRGTLMKDLLRGTSKFEEFKNSLSIQLVECSPALRRVQRQALQCVATSDDTNVPEDKMPRVSRISGSPVEWHVDLEQVPRGVPTIIIAQEFFDALPIYQFQKTSRGWCEKLIDVGEKTGEGFRFVLSPGPTTATHLFLSRRLKWASPEELENCEHIEVCPSALKLSKEIAKRVDEDSGAALIIDYGQDALVSDSLQAIKDHKFVNVLDDPGTADLSAHVDFAAIKKMVSESKSAATTFGPITQSQFLGMLGINFRLESLLKNAENDEDAEALQLGYWRLVGDGSAPWLDEKDDGHVVQGMGNSYKAIAIANAKLGAPVCFK